MSSKASRVFSASLYAGLQAVRCAGEGRTGRAITDMIKTCGGRGRNRGWYESVWGWEENDQNRERSAFWDEYPSVADSWRSLDSFPCFYVFRCVLFVKFGWTWIWPFVRICLVFSAPYFCDVSLFPGALASIRELDQWVPARMDNLESGYFDTSRDYIDLFYLLLQILWKPCSKSDLLLKEFNWLLWFFADMLWRLRETVSSYFDQVYLFLLSCMLRSSYYHVVYNYCTYLYMPVYLFHTSFLAIIMLFIIIALTFTCLFIYFIHHFMLDPVHK